MNADRKYGRLQFTIADLLAVMVIVAALGATSRLPVSLLQVIPLLVVLYLAKLRILRLVVHPCWSLFLYSLVLAALLPYVYYRAVEHWGSPHLDPLVNWVGVPVEAFTVPTVFFLYDILAHKQPSLTFYAIRSSLELLVLVPLWVFLWGWSEFLFFGWMWK